MKIKKEAKELYANYKKAAMQNESANIAFTIANSFANEAERIMEEENMYHFDKIFDDALKGIKTKKKVTGAIKSAAHTIIVKTWEYGDIYRDYSQVNEDSYYKELKKELK